MSTVLSARATFFTAASRPRTAGSSPTSSRGGSAGGTEPRDVAPARSPVDPVHQHVDFAKQLVFAVSLREREGVARELDAGAPFGTSMKSLHVGDVRPRRVVRHELRSRADRLRGARQITVL